MAIQVLQIHEFILRSKMTFHKKWLRVAPALLVLVSSCAFAQRMIQVTIQNQRFSPPEVRIAPGDSVTWTNREKRLGHSVLFPAENGLESEQMRPDELWMRTFKQPGTYSYRCGKHEEMKGIIIVE